MRIIGEIEVPALISILFVLNPLITRFRYDCLCLSISKRKIRRTNHKLTACCL